ncbi:hypothetical protein C0J52_24407 [Blattella germanica]|nr:hypothetical protein C0J52_24407 [Blattella germanica]
MVDCMIAVLGCFGAIWAEQLPYPLQFFYLAPNNVALLPPTPLMRSMPVHTKQTLEEDEAVVEGEATQFHSQDTRGRALFGYTTPHQARIEARSEDGTVQYWDDGSGFHAAGNNLPGTFAEVPQPVQDTPEVTAAKEQHFQLFQQALAAAVASGDSTEDVPAPSKPKPIEPDQEGVVVESDDPNSVQEDDQQELTRYPNLQNFPQNLFDPTQIHDANREAVIVDNPDIPSENSLRTAKTLQHVPGGFFYSFRYPVPMYVQVKTIQDGKPIVENNKVGMSVSQRAALFGAIPVAAVHDAQVPSYLRDSVKNYQVMPLYIETPASK